MSIVSRAITNISAELKQARLAIFGVFALNGFLLSLWAVHIPAVLEKTATSHGVLGILLLLLGGGAFAGMQAGGLLAGPAIIGGIAQIVPLVFLIVSALSAKKIFATD